MCSLTSSANAGPESLLCGLHLACLPFLPSLRLSVELSLPMSWNPLALGVQLGYPVALLSAKICVVAHYSLTCDVD
jgi:hypothetical protein